MHTNLKSSRIGQAERDLQDGGSQGVAAATPQSSDPRMVLNSGRFYDWTCVREVKVEQQGGSADAEVSRNADIAAQCPYQRTNACGRVAGSGEDLPIVLKVFRG